MSTQTRARAKYSRVRDPKESKFKQLIQRDSDICNNCFRLTHLTEERNVAVDTYREDGETHYWFREVDLPDRSWPLEHNTQFMLSDRMTGGTYKGCICGSPHTTIRPVTKETAMGHVERLLDRLEEKGFDVDRDEMRQYAWRLLRNPDRQGKQDSVFNDIVDETA